MVETGDQAKRVEVPPKRFDVLPKPIELKDTIAFQEIREAPDPEAGRDTDRDFLLRYN